MKSSFTKLLSAGCGLLMQGQAFGQLYHANDITPAGSTAGRLNGASGLTQV